MSDIPDEGARAILEQMARLQDAQRRGDTAAAQTLHRELHDRYGIAAVAEVMAQRDERERLGVEVELLRMFGPDRLYGREQPPS